MSKIIRSPILNRVLVCAGVGFSAVGLTLFGPAVSSARSGLSADPLAQDPYGQDQPVVDPFGQLPGDGADGFDMSRRSKARTAKKKKTADKSAAKSTGASAKGKSKKGAETAKEAAETKAEDGASLKFSQDIAPILVANCTGCHSGDQPGLKRGKLDLTSFGSLQKGSSAHKVVVPGKPDESSLVLRIKGEETPRMPQGANRVLADSAITKIEQWVREGARLDAGIDPKAAIESYAASPDQVRKRELAKLPSAEVDKKIQQVGLERWKQANPRLKPDIVPGDHFMIFSNLPKDRATTTMKGLETQYGHLKRLLGAQATSWVEKVSLYVFASRNDFIEFTRTVEGRDIEGDAASTARLAIPQPYIAVVDPAGARKEEPAGSKRKGRPKRASDGEADSGSERTLGGLLTEALGSGAVSAAGNPPRWLVLGIGSYLGSQVEPRSNYYARLRQTALANFEQGWISKANEALGSTDQISSDALHSIGFALVEAMLKSEMQPRFGAFVNGMLQGGEKLDEMLGKVFEGTREEFIEDTGNWVAKRYGRLE
jgi:hypothetical protein